VTGYFFDLNKAPKQLNLW